MTPCFEETFGILGSGETLYTRYPIVARALGLAAASKGILHTRRNRVFRAFQKAIHD